VLTVKECKAASVICRVENNQSIGERKNMNLPNVKVDLPVLQPKDIDDLQNFGVPNKVDFIAASFVQSAEDIHFIKKTLKESKHGDGSAIKATDPTLRPPSDHPAAPRRPPTCPHSAPRRVSDLTRAPARR
jgi:pyruvate kinase